MQAEIIESRRELPAWTYEDFSESSKPYDWLYDNYHGKSFLHDQQLELVTRAAQNVGFRGFKSLYRGYLRDKGERTTNVIADNYTDFPGQAQILKCGSYTCDAFGVRKEDGTIVCNHPITITQRLINIDTQIISLVIAFMRRGKWTSITVGKTELASANKIISIAQYGVGVDSENARDLVRFLSMLEDSNYEEIEERHSVGKLGWDLHCKQFIPYSAHLDFDGSPTYKATFESVKADGSLIRWASVLGEARFKNPVVRIALAASLASVLVKPLGALPFIVHIWGRTSNGKTLLLKSAASIWASPDDGAGFIRSFNTTVVGLETSAGFFNSLPLCVDELQIVKNRRDFDDLIYMLTEGQGRSRGTKDGGMQGLKSWRNCIISTGEMPIVNDNSGGGASARVLEIDCKSENIFDDFREVGEVITANYGHFGKAFVKMLLGNPENLNLAKEIRDECINELRECATVDKQIKSAAMLMTADRLADMLLWHSETVLDAQTMARYLTDEHAVNANERALEWLRGLIAQYYGNFTVSCMDSPRELWGKIDTDYIYIIGKVFNEKMSDAGFSPRAFLSWAIENNVVVPDVSGKSTVVVRFGQKLVRCVKLANDLKKPSELPIIGDE